LRGIINEQIRVYSCCKRNWKNIKLNWR